LLLWSRHSGTSSKGAGGRWTAPRLAAEFWSRPPQLAAHVRDLPRRSNGPFMEVRGLRRCRLDLGGSSGRR
jgi:hypothetical protein